MKFIYDLANAAVNDNVYANDNHNDYLHPTTSDALALASPSSLTRVHSYRPASSNCTLLILSVYTLSNNSYF